MSESTRAHWRGAVPWIISAALLVYVFGWATDWDRLREATDRANVPLFLLCAVADRMAFFIIWTWLSAVAVQRFVANVPVRSVFAIRGGSELARVVSNHLSDAAYFLGVVRLAGGRMDAVIASALVPVVSHFFVMLVQMTLALPFLRGGLAGNPSVVSAAVLLWGIIGFGALAVWLFRSGRVTFPGIQRVVAWLDRFPLRKLAPFLWGFAFLAVFDVQIQWLASRAFGVPIEWSALAARIPLVYLSFVIPTLGNFGTREMAWAALFEDFGDRDALIAYALSINTIFLLLNAMIGVLFLRRALELIGAVRQARREGETVPHPILKDPTDL
ncbi:MAG: hypothetical protein ACQGVC_15720 [Myxococcota bacterium]